MKMEDKAAELGMTVRHREGYREGEWIYWISAI